MSSMIQDTLHIRSFNHKLTDIQNFVASTNHPDAWKQAVISVERMQDIQALTPWEFFVVNFMGNIPCFTIRHDDGTPSPYDYPEFIQASLEKFIQHNQQTFYTHDLTAHPVMAYFMTHQEQLTSSLFHSISNVNMKIALALLAKDSGLSQEERRHFILENRENPTLWTLIEKQEISSDRFFEQTGVRLHTVVGTLKDLMELANTPEELAEFKTSDNALRVLRDNLESIDSVSPFDFLKPGFPTEILMEHPESRKKLYYAFSEIIRFPLKGHGFKHGLKKLEETPIMLTILEQWIADNIFETLNLDARNHFSVNLVQLLFATQDARFDNVKKAYFNTKTILSLGYNNGSDFKLSDVHMFGEDELYKNVIIQYLCTYHGKKTNKPVPEHLKEQVSAIVEALHLQTEIAGSANLYDVVQQHKAQPSNTPSM